MAMVNPRGRVNYEPNSWGGVEGGPRECHETGFRSFPADEEGRKVRERSESFADHYSQARQFYLSQTKSEQGHIADALIFELSKVEKAAIRARLVSHLPHIDATLADRVTKGLGLREKVQPAHTAKEPRTDLKPSAALSIVKNGPKSFAGRKVGILVTDGADRGVFDMLKSYLGSQHRDPQLLVRYADQLGNKAVFKRLGYLAATFLSGEKELVQQCRARLSMGNARLDPKLPAKRLVTAWRIWVPANFSKESSK